RDKKGMICFVEVKARGLRSVGLPREFVDRRKQERLRIAAACYLSTHELDAPARFDVAEVYTGENGQVLNLEYLENAFT
ncbi:MAG: YraN family protein, partial [Oscillibacter sp.]